TALDRSLAEELAGLGRAGLLREPPRLDGPQGPVVRMEGRALVCACSTDYLGVCADPGLAVAVAGAARACGAGAGASRLIAGTLPVHAEAERCLAQWLGADDAVLFSSGWAANVGTIAALAGPEDLVVSDALNHASIVDGCKLSRARRVVVPHRDLDALRRSLEAERRRARRALVVTDAVFSMDGVRAPLAALRTLCDAYEAALVVDEAHALGVIGPEGRGACAEAGVVPDVLVGTLGKALGLAGAFVAGSATLVRFLRQRARSHVFSTALAPALAGAVPTAVRLARSMDEARRALRGAAEDMRAALRHQGWDVRGEPDVPILPVIVGEPEPTMRLSHALREQGVFAHGIRPPTVPEGTSRIRLTLSAAHDTSHHARIVDAFARTRGIMCGVPAGGIAQSATGAVEAP
ncbi:MAG: 8-amino-7-oxononanoate synthase, partial [Myxococcales bacterium]|nr:8-amino-7-oxononanoate synthase [Myxococcales bacterium]